MALGLTLKAKTKAKSVKIHAMLKACPEHGEEHAIHDFELGGIKIGEFESIEDVVKIATAIEEHGNAFIAAASQYTLEEALTKMEDGDYQGEYTSRQDWAESFMEDTGTLDQIPENLRFYFDYEKYARDCELSGDIDFVEHEGSIHVFNNH